MRWLIVLMLALFAFPGNGIRAQAVNRSFFTGVQLTNLASGQRARQPMVFFHGNQSLKLARHWSLGADVVVAKNTVPYSRAVVGKVMEFYQLNLPFHLDYRLSRNCFLEGGAFLGAVANSGNIYLTEFVQVRYLEDMVLRFDVGLMAGVSFRAGKWAKINFRYNHGLLPSVPISGERVVKDRLISTGLTIIL